MPVPVPACWIDRNGGARPVTMNLETVVVRGRAQRGSGSRLSPGRRGGAAMRCDACDACDAKRAEASRHGRVSYGHSGAGDSGRAGDWWPKRLSKMRGSWCSKRFFGLPFWRDRKVIRLPGRDPARPRQRTGSAPSETAGPGVRRG